MTIAPKDKHLLPICQIQLKSILVSTIYLTNFIQILTINECMLNIDRQLEAQFEKFIKNEILTNGKPSNK